MILQELALLARARKVLAVNVEDGENGIRSGYHRRIVECLLEPFDALRAGPVEGWLPHDSTSSARQANELTWSFSQENKLRFDVI